MTAQKGKHVFDHLGGTQESKFADGKRTFVASVRNLIFVNTNPNEMVAQDRQMGVV